MFRQTSKLYSCNAFIEQLTFEWDADTDEDGVNDGDEVAAGSDPCSSDSALFSSIVERAELMSSEMSSTVSKGSSAG